MKQLLIVDFASGNLGKFPGFVQKMSEVNSLPISFEPGEIPTSTEIGDTIPSATVTSEAQVFQEPLKVTDRSVGGAAAHFKEASLTVEENVALLPNTVFFASQKLPDQTPNSDGGKLIGEKFEHTVDSNPYKAFLRALASIEKDAEEVDVLMVSHGMIVGGRHYLEWEGEDNNTDIIPTKTVFAQMSKTLPDTKFHIFLTSCYSGMAHDVVSSLPEGSTLITTSDPASPLAAQPFRNAVEKYPEKTEYDIMKFIAITLLNRDRAGGEEPISIRYEMIPSLISDLVVKSVVKKEGAETNAYQLDVSSMDFSQLTGDIVETLKSSLGNGGYVDFMAQLIRCKASSFNAKDIAFLVDKYDGVLSFLALRIGEKTPFNASEHLPFANHWKKTESKLSVDEYAEIFMAASNPSALTMLDLLERSSTVVGNNGRDNTDFMDALTQSVCSGSEVEEFASVKIGCDIVSAKHYKADPGYHILRISFNSYKETDIFTIMEIPIQDAVAIDLLEGRCEDFCKVLESLVSAQITKQASEAVDMMQKISGISESQLKELESIMKVTSLATIKKAKGYKDPLIKKICNAVDKCIKDIVAEHRVETTICHTVEEAVEMYGEYLRTIEGNDTNLVSILGSEGNALASYDTTTDL